MRSITASVVLVLLSGATARGQAGLEAAELLAQADAEFAAGEPERAAELYARAIEVDEARGWSLAAVDSARSVGVTARAMAGLRRLPDEMLRGVRAVREPRVLAGIEEARLAADPYLALARLREQHPASLRAPQLALRMAEDALERGHLERAGWALDRLLETPDLGDEDTARACALRLRCALELGEPELVRHLASPDDGERIVLGLVKGAAATRERREARLDLSRGDLANRAAVATVASRFGASRFAPRALDEPGRATTFSPPGRERLDARHLPLLHGDRVLVVCDDRVLAFDRRTGEPGPRIPLPGPALSRSDGAVLLGGAIDQGLLVASFVAAVTSDESFRGIPIKVSAPLRRLAAFDLEAWRWAWNHARTLPGTALDRWSFRGPPLAMDGVVWAPATRTEGGEVVSGVCAFDGRTGAPLWEREVARRPVTSHTMFGESAGEALCTPLALAGGVVFHATSTGAVAALDATTGRPLWTTRYPTVEVRAPRGYYADVREPTWEPSAPVVHEGVVVVTPLDADVVMGLDAASGAELWRARRRAYATDSELRWVVGAAGRAGDALVVLAGRDDVRALHLRTGELAWSLRTRGAQVTGRGCLAGGVALVPLAREVLLVELATGKRAGRHPLDASGNLALRGDDLIVTGGGRLSVVPILR